MILDYNELKKLPYFSIKHLDGRCYPLMPFYNEKKFVQPLLRDRKLLLMENIELIEGMYLSREVLDPKKDMHLGILEMLFQEFSISGLFSIANSLYRDILNFGASIEKHDLITRDYADNRKKKGGHSYLISTELEYVFYNVRSIFDLLQLISTDIWAKTKLSDSSIKKKELPKRFSKVVLSGRNKDIFSSTEIAKRYGLPISLADFYEKEAAFFRFCRSFRDDISHKGATPDWVFMFEDGAAVSSSQSPFCNFTFWNESEMRTNNLGSVRALISYIAKRSIEATENFCSALRTNIRLHESIAPEWHVFLRGSHVHHLLDIAGTIRNPWLLAKNDIG